MFVFEEEEGLISDRQTTHPLHGIVEDLVNLCGARHIVARKAVLVADGSVKSVAGEYAKVVLCELSATVTNESNPRNAQ